MKKISLYFSALAVAAVSLVGCDDKWETPPMYVPEEGADIEATITIADLKAMYWQDNASYGTPVTKLSDGRNAIIKGTIVSSTESGNIYKSVYVQDSTAAICIGIDTAAVNAVLPMGVGVAIDVTGLQIGRYSGAMQLGKADGSAVNRITYKELKPHVALDYWGGHLDTTLVSLAELRAIQNQQGIREMGGKLVRINNVRFQEAGQAYTDGGTTSRHITDSIGNSIIVYNSSYSDFAYELLPYGYGDVVGILSNYNTQWQLLLIDSAGVMNFTGDGAPDEEKPAPELPEQYKDALSVAEAIALVSSGDVPKDNTMVFGRISSIDNIDPGYGNATYTIMDQGGTKGLIVYRGYWLNGNKFTSEDQLQVGEYIVVQGTLISYNGTPELQTGNKVLYYFGDNSGGDTPGTDTPAPDAPTGVISVAEALSLIAANYSGTAQVKGIISKIDDIDTGSYGNATYYIVDKAGDANALEIYRGYWFNGDKFTSSTQLEVGAEVIVEGKLVNYNGTYEMTTGSKIISYNGQTSAPDAPETPDTPAGDAASETFQDGLGFPEKTANAPSSPTTYTSSATGITYTIMGCYISAYAGSSYLMINGKNHSGAFISWKLGYACSKLELATSSGCSTNAASKVKVYANDNLIGEYAANVQNSTVTVDIPAAYQAAGTVYKVESATDSYNQQFTKFTYVKAN